MQINILCKKAIPACLFISFFLFSSSAMAAATGPSIDVYTMLQNIQAQLGPLNKLVSGFAYVSGYALIIKALYKLKSFGDMRSMAAHAEVHGAMIELVIGAALIYAPSVVQILNTTLSGSDAPLQYTTTNNSFGEMAATIVAIVQFIGVVAVIRGLFIFHKLGSGQHQQATFGKGLAHLLGGTLAFNIVWAKDVLFSTLGIS